MFQGQFDLETATPAETAIPDLLFERGLYWASGRSGDVNLVAAHKWFNLAALKGRADAISMRREVAEMMSDGEIAAAQREARAWMTSHYADTRHAKGRNLVSIYLIPICPARLSVPAQDQRLDGQ